MVGRSRARGRYPSVRPTIIDGHRFASAHEARRYLELLLLQRAGQISELELQVSIPIVLDGRPVLVKSKGYPAGRVLRYVADFGYRERGELVIEDAKGHPTDVYKLKRALLLHMGIKIRES